MTDQAPPTLPAEPVNVGQHATWIAGRAQTLLSHYFSPDLSPEVVEAAIDDWVKALISVPRHAIETACETYLRDQPRRRPTPGDIRQRGLAHMASTTKRQALPPADPPRAEPRVSAEEAERICRAAGFTAQRIEILTRQPMARTLEEAVQVKEHRKPHWSETCAPDDPRMAELRRARAANRLMNPERAE